MRDGSGVHDTIVNQLLTKIDGVDALNNILLIGMTNRWLWVGGEGAGGGRAGQRAGGHDGMEGIEARGHLKLSCLARAGKLLPARLPNLAPNHLPILQERHAG